MSQLLMRRPNLDDLPPLPALPPGTILREYKSEDLESLAALLRAAFEDPAWTPEKVRRELIEDPTVARTFVIAADGALVATASTRLLPERFPDAGYVHWVAADPARKGQGLGYIITLAVLHEFVRMGCKSAVLETDDHRLAAIKTYRNLGFEPEHRDASHAERWAIILSNLLAAANM